MAIRFSPSTGGFYLDGVHAAIPGDVVAVSPDRHRQLFAAQAKGRAIVANAAGRPVLAPPERASVDQHRAALVAALRGEARRRILLVAGFERQSNDNALIAMHALAVANGGDPPVLPLAEAVLRRQAIDAIRARCDALERALDAVDGPGLQRFNPLADENWS